jgi:K+-transporting ATPase KdpF subunit
VVAGEDLRKVVTNRTSMDYIIAGIAAVLLFFYLIYALLKPERF